MAQRCDTTRIAQQLFNRCAPHAGWSFVSNRWAFALTIGQRGHTAAVTTTSIFQPGLANCVRLVLDVEAKDGETHPAKYSLPGLMRLLKAFPPKKRPKLVCGDSAFDNHPVMTELESVGHMYLSKLRQTACDKRLIERNFVSRSIRR